MRTDTLFRLPRPLGRVGGGSGGGRPERFRRVTSLRLPSRWPNWLSVASAQCHNSRRGSRSPSQRTSCDGPPATSTGGSIRDGAAMLPAVEPLLLPDKSSRTLYGCRLRMPAPVLRRCDHAPVAPRRRKGSSEKMAVRRSVFARRALKHDPLELGEALAD